MQKLINCMAAGILLLAIGMDSPASARGGGGGRGGGGVGFAARGGSFGASGFGAGAFRSSVSPVFRGNASVGGGSPVFRGNNFAVRGGDRDGDRRARRFFGRGVVAYGAYPYGYYDDGSGYVDDGYYDNGNYDNGDCSYVWVRRNGELHRVYTCQ